MFLAVNNIAGTASSFYQQVFNTPFYGEKQPASYNKDDVMLFEFEDPRISGGVVKLPQGLSQVRGGMGGVCVWWLVEDVDRIVGTIEAAGGKVVSEVLKEGVNGLYRYFEDPERNVGVAYQFVGQEAPK